MRSVLVVILACVVSVGQDSSPGASQRTALKDMSARQLASAYDGLWTQFVAKFRGETDTNVRLKLIDDYGQKVNALLAPHLGRDTIRRVLPLMANTRLLDLQSSFLGVSGRHPEPSVRATALLHFAEYLGNNRRLEECDVTLGHLKKKYGELRFRQTTFAKAADEAGFYFRHLSVGREAPPTTGQDVDGTLFSLSDYRGKVVMLRFWGDWCPACRAMYPYEREITRKYRNRRFALIGVNSDPRERCQTSQDRSHLTWRSFWDGGDTKGPIATLYQIEDWPRIIIIDAQGVIRMNARGLDQGYVTALLEELIQEAEQQDQRDA